MQTGDFNPIDVTGMLRHMQKTGRGTPRDLIEQGVAQLNTYKSTRDDAAFPTGKQIDDFEDKLRQLAGEWGHPDLVPPKVEA